jgi:ATP-dependent Clp protease ATP-binding subunit ClpA
VGWAFSRSIYHGLAAATAAARRHGHQQVTGAHLIAAFLDDPGSVVARAASSPATSALLHGALAADAALQCTPNPAPIWLAADVRYAVLHTEGDPDVPNTGHVLLRLLADGHTPTSSHLHRIGVDLTDMATRIADLVGCGAQDEPTPA